MANLSNIVQNLASRAFGAVGGGMETAMKGAGRVAGDWWEGLKKFGETPVVYGRQPSISTGGGIESLFRSPLEFPTPTTAPNRDPFNYPGMQQYYEESMAKHGMNPQGTPFPTPAGSVIPGFTTRNPRLTPELADLITTKSGQYGLHPALMTAQLQQESSLDPTKINEDVERGVRARGMAQIVEKFHPEVSDVQAFDPEFAIDWMARYLSEQARQKNLEQAIASYFVGPSRVGGGPEVGRDERGLGPQGREYLNNVIRNLDPEVIRQLGLLPQY